MMTDTDDNCDGDEWWVMSDDDDDDVDDDDQWWRWFMMMILTVALILMLGSFYDDWFLLTIKFLQESWPLCSALLSCWVATSFKIEADDATTAPDEHHIKFKEFVKVDSKGSILADQPGKYGNHNCIPFLPYNLRSFAIFTADLVRVWELLSMLPSFEEKHKQYQQHVNVKPENQNQDEMEAKKDKQQGDVSQELLFLAYADAALDMNKCPDNTTISDSLKNLQTHGSTNHSRN